MHLPKHIVRIFCGAALVCAVAVVPAIWALFPAPVVGRGAYVSASVSPAQSRAGKLDINTATEDQLKVLPGMGPVYARRIIAGRPYREKYELISRGILPQMAYDKIKDEIVAHRVKK